MRLGKVIRQPAELDTEPLRGTLMQRPGRSVVQHLTLRTRKLSLWSKVFRDI